MGGSDGGDDLVITTISDEERNALLSVWKWQSSSKLDCPTAAFDASLMQSMMYWPAGVGAGADTHAVANMMPRMRLSRLEPRSMAAKLGDDTLAIVLVDYHLDKSDLASALSLKHAMVVEAIALNPAIPEATQRSLADAGVQKVLRSLAQCHSMRLTFANDLEAAAWSAVNEREMRAAAEALADPTARGGGDETPPLTEELY